MLPEFFGNAVKSLNSASRIILKTCEGTERAVDGIDRIATLALQQQTLRLERELTKMSLPA
jgi:hypothetical protein